MVPGGGAGKQPVTGFHVLREVTIRKYCGSQPGIHGLTWADIPGRHTISEYLLREGCADQSAPELRDIFVFLLSIMVPMGENRTEIYPYVNTISTRGKVRMLLPAGIITLLVSIRKSWYTKPFPILVMLAGLQCVDGLGELPGGPAAFLAGK